MNKRFISTVISLLSVVVLHAQIVTALWELSDKDNLSAYSFEGDNTYTSLITPSFSLGSNLSATATLTKSGAADGYEAVSYTPNFTSFTPSTRTGAKTSGHCVSFSITTANGHSFKPTKISFDAAKVGTDGGNIDVYYNIGSNSDVAIATGLSPLRNKIQDGNSTGYSTFEYSLGDVLVNNSTFTLYLYIYNLNGTDAETPKQIAFRNIKITGATDEAIKTANDYIASFSCTGNSSTIDLTSSVSELKNGGLYNYSTKLYGDPTDFNVICKTGYTAEVSYSGNVATVKIYESSGTQVFYFEVLFKVTYRQPKGQATPLKRGLMSVSLSGANMGTGNLVSWRMRKTDPAGTKFKLYRGGSSNQSTPVNGGAYISGKSNYRDASGTASMYYKLEVYDANDNLIDTEVSSKTWDNQSFVVPTITPIDNRNGATYTPNDCSFCDMDGDGEYEIILKWRPSNEKDAASSGTTSNAIFDCYKLDGTQLWRIDLGPNFFNSAHTIQFIAWDFDGDGYGEFMCKTAPGTIDGEGNYVLLNDDDPTANLLSGRGKQDHGSEYITVFDGETGAEISTIFYHTAYGDVSTSVWGDSNQNRSERYLAAIAWLDGPDNNPSPIFARGYYAGAFVGAYDFDGTELKERWVSRNTTKNKGLWGEGAHWISVGDCDGDEKQEIVYGSAALDDDGSLLYRTGLGHGDALHLGDFIPERDGMEVFMAHEEKPYGCDLRDAKTGELLIHLTASGDTGRGLAAHFDSSSKHSQFLYSAASGVYDCVDASEIASSWAIGQSGAGINNRIYWDGDLYDEFFDKSIIAHWNPTTKAFDRYKFNNGNYLWGTLNNGSKYNPCILADMLGDWREEIITYNSDNNYLYINATSFESDYGLPHLMDDLNYRAQVINQNCCYNQPPHLSYDPAYDYGEQQEEPDTPEEPEEPDTTDDYNVVVKMTYVDYDNPTTSYGEVAEARSGYNKISNSTVEMTNTAWGCDHITYLQIDASECKENKMKIDSATLTFQGSGSTDSRRATEWGVGYNSSIWSSTMTYETADRSIITLGDTQWGSSKSASTFDDFTFDITDAFADDDDYVVTIIIYEKSAAGGYVKNPAVSITASENAEEPDDPDNPDNPDDPNNPDNPDNPDDPDDPGEADYIRLITVGSSLDGYDAYTLQGVRVEKITQPGTYIINNRKVLVK